jgi:glycosyltransferase involved in cell wall biosynthesis
MPLLSVIIPTHNRADILKQCLKHLERQTIASDIEVIVMNDIQDDKDFEHIANSSWQIPIHFETIPPCHQGSARNKGVAKATTQTVLFLGDDIFLAPDACKKHLDAHTKAAAPVAVLGSIDWDPGVGITKTMRWLTRSGWQFGFEKIKRFADDYVPESMQHLFVYTSNVSVPMEVAKRLPFREDITLYGWEDIEWGMRLKKGRIKLYYEPKAKGLHHHHITLPDSLKRMEVIGASAAVLANLVDDFDRLPKGWKRVAYAVFSRFPTMAGRHRKAFLKGIKRTP